MVIIALWLVTFVARFVPYITFDFLEMSVAYRKYRMHDMDNPFINTYRKLH